MNVLEIEKQTRRTEENIALVDLKISELPTIKDGLVYQYKKEKEKQLQQTLNVDHVNERKAENAFLFGSVEKQIVVHDCSINRRPPTFNIVDGKLKNPAS